MDTYACIGGDYDNDGISDNDVGDGDMMVALMLRNIAL